MKKIKFLYFFLLATAMYVTSSFAQDPNLNKQIQQGGAVIQDCKDCQSSNNSDLITQTNELAGVLNKPFECGPGDDPQSCLLIDWLKWKHQSYSKNCQGFFLDANGKVGAFSKILAELMINDIKKNKEKSLFVNNNEQFQKLCPGFDKFTLNQKLAFHGWIFELTAFPENVCTNANSVVKGVNSAAACMLQLNYPTNMRGFYSSGAKNADGTSEKHCKITPKELLTDRGCLSCGFDVYKWHMTKYDGNPFGEIANGKKINGSYWASQNPLSPAAENCFVKYLDAKNSVKKDPKTGKPLFLTQCKSLGANWEWTPRYKFFKRIQRFPLCKTDIAKQEVTELKKYLDSKK